MGVVSVFLIDYADFRPITKYQPQRFCRPPMAFVFLEAYDQDIEELTRQETPFSPSTV
jgi:hypothetical protein